MGLCKTLVATHPARVKTHTARRRRAWEELLVDGRGRRAVPAHIDQTEAILFALAQAVEQRDRDTAGHCERMALVSVAMGVAMKMPHASLLALYRGGFLHDIGKVGMPDSILFKPDKLTGEEWVTMRSHTVRGEEICRPLKTLRPV